MNWTTWLTHFIRTAPPDITPRDAGLMGAIGLCEEAGEVAGLLKKATFHGHPLERTALIKELGDVLWYFTLICETHDIALDTVMARNIAKLEARYPDGFSSAASINRGE